MVTYLQSTGITVSGTQYTIDFGVQGNVHIVGAILVGTHNYPVGVNLNGTLRVLGYCYVGSDIGSDYGTSFNFKTWIPSLSNQSGAYTMASNDQFYLPAGNLHMSVMAPSYMTGITTVVLILAD